MQLLKIMFKIMEQYGKIFVKLSERKRKKTKKETPNTWITTPRST